MNCSPSEKRLMQLLLLKGPLSRKALANELSLTRAAVTLSSQNLLQAGFLVEAGSLVSPHSGRREQALAIRQEGATLAGIDVHRHSALLVLLTLGGESLFSQSYPSLDEAIAALRVQSTLYPSVLGLGVTLRGFSTWEQYAKKNPNFGAHFSALPYPVHYLNNVESLAYLYELLHPEDSNFILLKYGPGVGSSVFVNAHPLKGQDGSSSEIGHGFLNEGRRIEDAISFETLLGGDYEEKEGAQELLKRPEALSRCLAALAFSLVNANYLLSLDKLILSGILLSAPSVYRALEEKIQAIDPDFDLQKITLYPDYERINEKKAALQVFADHFLI